MNTSHIWAYDSPSNTSGAALSGHETPAIVPMDIVFIEGFTAQTVIGIYDNELHAAQPLVIDVHAGVPHAKACSTDHIVDTIDYGAVRERLVVLMRDHKVQLLEALAETIAEILVLEFGAHWVRVKVVKPKKCPDVQAMGVMIERTRADLVPAQTIAAGSSTVLNLIGAGMVPGSH